MKIKFVTDEEVNAIRPGTYPSIPWAPFIEELYKHPNQWAEFNEKVNQASSAYNVRNTYKDIEVRLTGGNALPINHPDKKPWTVYLRYVPSDETF